MWRVWPIRIPWMEKPWFRINVWCCGSNGKLWASRVESTCRLRFWNRERWGELHKIDGSWWIYIDYMKYYFLYHTAPTSSILFICFEIIFGLCSILLFTPGSTSISQCILNLCEYPFRHVFIAQTPVFQQSKNGVGQWITARAQAESPSNGSNGNIVVCVLKKSQVVWAMLFLQYLHLDAFML